MTEDRGTPGEGPLPDDTPAFVDEPGTADQAQAGDEPAADGGALLADAPDTTTGKAQELFEEDQPGPGV
jgi:hypothetical protein